jgi:hypothetical protein
MKMNSVKNQSIRYNCNKCNKEFTTYKLLDTHSYIHINPINCYFPNCGKIFAFRHSYQYKQHIDGHNGGLNIKCKFCNHISKSFSANTLHMKSKHIEEYIIYNKKINESNEDIKKLDSNHITNLTNKYININNQYLETPEPKANCKKSQIGYEGFQSSQDDPELTYIEYNKHYDDQYNEINNLHLFADIALSYN